MGYGFTRLSSTTPCLRTWPDPIKENLQRARPFAGKAASTGHFPDSLAWHCNVPPPAGSSLQLGSVLNKGPGKWQWLSTPWILHCF